MVQILCYAVNISDNYEPYKSPQKKNVTELMHSLLEKRRDA